MQGELLVGVQGRADLEGGGRRGTNAGQHLRLAERLRECVAGGVARVALQLGQGEGPGPQVRGRWLGGRWHAVEGRVGWHHVGGGLAGLRTLDLCRVAVSLRERHIVEAALCGDSNTSNTSLIQSIRHDK